MREETREILEVENLVPPTSTMTRPAAEEVFFFFFLGGGDSSIVVVVVVSASTVLPTGLSWSLFSAVFVVAMI